MAEKLFQSSPVFIQNIQLWTINRQNHSRIESGDHRRIKKTGIKV